MAWENASGFGATQNPLLLNDSWLAQIDDTFDNSGQRSQTLWSGTTLPTGITVNIDYLNLPSTSWQDETLESHDNVTWQYRKDDDRAGIKIIINNSVYLDPGIYMSGGQLISFGFVINHEIRKAKVSAAYGNGTDYNYISVYYKDDTNAEVLYNALVGNPYIANIWHSVKSISGQLGTFRFSSLPDDVLTGDTITGLREEDFETWNQQTSFFDLAVGTPIGSTIMALCSGNNNPLNLTVNELGLFVWNFFVESTGIFSVTVGGYPADFAKRWAFMIDYENQVAKAVVISPYTEAGFTYYFYMPLEMTDGQMSAMYAWIMGSNADDDPDVNHEEEGTGVSPWHDIPITGVSEPGKSAIATGFTSMYEVTDTQLKNLSDFLWSSSFVDVVSRFFSDPRDIIVGLSIFPMRPDTGSLTEIKAGGISTGIQGLPLTSQYKIIDDFGSIRVKKAKGNFLDYSPYTKITAHLPYVGEHSLDVSDVVGNKLTLKYIVDFLTGACVAEIDVTKTDPETGAEKTYPRYFFGGTCSVQIPTSAEDFGRMYSAVIGAGATVGATLATIATGGIALPSMIASCEATKNALTVGAGIGATANTLGNLMNMSPDVSYSSGSGGINGLLTSQSAYLIIEQPKEKIAKNQPSFVGRPSYINKKLSNVSGYNKCLSVHLDKFSGMDTERTEAENALLNGVRFETGSETPTYTPTSSGLYGIIFLKLESDKNTIGKTWSQEETDIVTIEGKMLFDKDILKPSFIVSGNFSEFNYAYIPVFNRFYYIDTMQVKTGSMMEISFVCDVLQSFATDIKKNQAILERSESNYNVYMNDGEYWTQQDKEVETVPFKNSSELEALFSRNNNTYILTIAGG